MGDQNGKNGQYPKKNGRPTVRTPELIERVKQALSLGLDWGTAAKCAGVGERTLRRWRDEDPELSAELDEAKANAVQRAAFALWKRIAAGDTAAIRFFLMTRSEEFKDKAGVAVNVDNRKVVLGGPQLPEGAELKDFVRQLIDASAEQGLIEPPDGAASERA